MPAHLFGVLSNWPRLIVLKRASFSPNTLRRVWALVLVTTLLTVPVQPVLAAPLEGIGIQSSKFAFEIWGKASGLLSAFGYRSDGMPNKPAAPERHEPKPPPTKADREAKVHKLRLHPSNEMSIGSRQEIVLGAIPLDQEGNPIHGLGVEWSSSDKQVIFVKPNGKAIAGRPGTATLTARAGNKQESIKVNVYAVTQQGTNARSDSIRKQRQSKSRLLAVRAAYAHAHAPMPAPPDDRLPDNETTTLYQPTNDVGKPEGKTEAGASVMAAANEGTETPGSANFSFNMPLVGLPGRRLNAGLRLAYNSRVWHKVSGSPTKVYFDVDSGWPAPGFRLGYGQLENQVAAGFTLTEPDGTRRQMTSVGSYLYRTTDGSFITYSGSQYGGIVTYPDGTKVTYYSINGPRIYPTSVTDRHGNIISIYYVNGSGPKIQWIQDTLGRYIQFHYEGNDLIAITAPGYNGGADRQVARFYYETINFYPYSLFLSGSVQVTAPATARILRYVYIPGTGNGYKYDYSPYGMIYKTSQLRGMGVSTTSLTTMGSVTSDGEAAATTQYDYPLGMVNLTDVPKFSSRTDDWAGRTTASAPTWTFSSNEATGLTTVTNPAPDSRVTETQADPTTGQLQSITIKHNGAVLSKSGFTWEWSTAGQRMQKIETTNEAGQTKATTFTYDPSTIFNNVTIVSERDFAAPGTLGTELRRVETSYQNSTNYTNRGLIHLPASVSTYAGGSSTRSAYTTFIYDQGNLVDRPNITMYDPAYNPYSPPQEWCDWVWNGHYEEWVCNYYNVYNPANGYRGNVTTVTSYADAANLTGARTDSMVYDIAGNVVETTANCCRRKTFQYSDSFYNAYVTSQTQGETGHLSTSAGYDFNTGLVRTNTSENNRTTTIHYNAASLRTSEILRPMPGGSFASTTITFQDLLSNDPDSAHRHSYVLTQAQRDGGSPLPSYEFLDGRGRVVRTFNSLSGQGWVTQDILYDELGRQVQSSQPYYSTGVVAAINPSGRWTTSVYDRLDRTTAISWPSGDTGSTLSSASVVYAGTVSTSTDPALRQKRQVTDALGRLIHLDEPNDAGSLGTVEVPTQRTSYEYDPLDNLTKITQGAQVRQFKYNSLSEITHEKQVEANATLNASGAYVGGGTWTGVYVYNAFGLMTDAYDARGVRTQVTYDTLNRLKTLSYSGESSQTPTVTYTYGDEITPTPPADSKGRVAKFETASVGGTPSTAQEFDYDIAGRIVTQRQKIGATTYTLGYSYNYLSQPTTSTYPSGRVITYGYDQPSRLLSVSDSANRISASAITYEAHGGLSSENWGNGAVETVTYNRSQQPKTLTLNRSGELQRFEYTYGTTDINTGAVDESKNAGQIGRVESFISGVKQWQQRYKYDSVSRLTHAREVRGDNSQQVWQVAYTHDRWSNRYQSGAENSGVGYEQVVGSDINTGNNRFNSTTPDPVAYDDAGQMTSDGKFRGMNYQYDANGRMRAAWRYENGGYTTATFDGMGQRVQTALAGVTRNFVYNISGQVVAEYRQGVLDKEYVYQDGALLASDEQPRTCTITTEQYVRNFYTGTLARQPNSTELAQWTTAIDQALAQGYGAVLGQVRNLGTTLFTSQEYINRNRTNSEFVTDLYWGYLHRTYDQGGYDNWMAALNAGYTREQVRGGFAFSVEFENNATTICTTTGGSASVKYVFTDHQGSARAVMDGGGNVVARHDYLPFGEELWSGVGMRTAGQQFGAMDQNRMRYAMMEKDEATGLDHTWWRKYEDTAGRWTTPDPVAGDQSDPQSLNRYSYTRNDPVNFVDPNGLLPMCGWFTTGWDGGPLGSWVCFGDAFPFGGFNPKPGGGGNPTPAEPQKSDCGKFVDELIRRGQGINQAGRGRSMALWARDTLAPQAKAGKLGFSGFKAKYVAGGQNGFALVHIAGFAGVTLLGPDLEMVVSGRTGYEIARQQFQQDTDELNKGLQLQAAGAKTIDYDGNKNYPLQQYIDEKHAERENDGAGTSAGRILEKMRNGNIKVEQARQELMDLLCDK